MDLKQLRVLSAIAHTGSFQAAADQLHLTQPAISHQLKKLEAELGETLVLRSRPKAKLLPAGVDVLAAAERIDAELEELGSRFSSPAPTATSGVLRVAASTLGIIYLYGDLLEQFIKRYPRIELVVTAAESGIGAARHVLTGTTDVAFTPFPVNLPNLQKVLLGDTEHVIIVARSHALAARKTVSVDEIRAYPFIRYQSDAGSRAMSDQAFAACGGYPRIFMESNDTEFIKRVVALGMGTAMVPAFTVGNEARDRRLAMLRMKGPAVRQEFGLVCRTKVRMRALDLFREFCLEHRAGVGPSAQGRRRSSARSGARPR
jgi:DNA-binding transcriptional LysR family regulator